jgi:NADH-quinone oxidoreductase subunit J
MFTPVHIIFYLFALVAVLSAIAVITAKNTVRSVLSLVVTFFAMAGIWMILQAEFLSLILLLVYVGAVMTLFLFVVMMLNIDKVSKQSGFVRYLPFGIIIIVLMTGLLIVALRPDYFGFGGVGSAPISNMANVSNIQQLGSVLYTAYAYPFEIAGIVLLAAIIAAITLAHRAPFHRKVQNIDKQLMMGPSESVRIIKMKPEPKQKGP